MAGEAFAGSLCEGELGALFCFSSVADIPDFGLVPRVTIMKNCIHNLFFAVWKHWRILVMAFYISGRVWPPWRGQKTETPVFQSDCCGSGASMVIIRTVSFPDGHSEQSFQENLQPWFI